MMEMKMAGLEAVLDSIDNNLDEAVERLFSLIRIESISTDPEYVEECR